MLTILWLCFCGHSVVSNKLISHYFMANNFLKFVVVFFLIVVLSFSR